MSEESKIFDWNSKTLTLDNCKNESGYSSKLGNNLMSVLTLPAVDYFLPYLAEGGFPDYLIQHPEIWKSVFAEFVPIYIKEIDNLFELERNIGYEYRDRMVEIYRSNPALDQRHRGEIIDYLSAFDRVIDTTRFYIYLKAWWTFLDLLAAQAGKPVAIELERWIYSNYLCHKFNQAIDGWWSVFVASDSVPDCLEPMLSQIEELYGDYDSFGDDIFSQMEKEMERLFDRYYDEYDLKSIKDRGLNGDYTQDHRPPYGAKTCLLKQVWKRTRVLSILQRCARSLNGEEVQIVVEWAKDYARNTGRNDDFPMSETRLQLNEDDVNKLCEDELITTRDLFANFPSILDVNQS
jgi:hypothetical protein